MAEVEEDVVAQAASPVPSDYKRKLEDLETQEDNAPPSSDRMGDEEHHGAADVAGDSHEPKCPKIDVKDGFASENGFEGGKPSEDHKIEETERSVSEDEQEPHGAQPPSEEESLVGKDQEEAPTADGRTKDDAEDLKINDSGHPPEEETKTLSKGETEKPFQEAEEGVSDDQATSRKMEVPNDRVGVLIGKGGDTIRYLQYNSGAKIQITRDADADPNFTTRPVELIGTTSSINKAEKLINAVIAEADAGGSPSLVARGLPSAQTTGAVDQLEMQVPNEKVGLIIGRGGDTIKTLQAKSGACIQLIPQHLPEGDGSKERTVQVTGDKKQIEMAREMIKDVMDQTMRRSPLSSGFSQQQSYQPRGPSCLPHWAPQGPHSSHPTPYSYQQRGPYSSRSMQYPPSAYGGYPPQHMAPRANFGWEQGPPLGIQGPPPYGGAYALYSGQGGHPPNHPVSGPLTTGHQSGPAPAMGPPSQSGYNYGPPHGLNYGHPAPYSQTVPQQTYGHRFDELKYESHATSQHPYGHGSCQPIYPQVGSQPVCGAQQQGKQSLYGMTSQSPPPQSYSHPRTAQPGDIPYQGTVQSSQSYGLNVPQQQQYQYPTNVPMQQACPSYGSASVTDGYNQAMAASGPGYTQQGGQPILAYGQPGGQPAAGFVQGPTGAYGSYTSLHPSYPEQPTPNNASYGYQAPQDSSYTSALGPVDSAPPSSQQQVYYTQPAQTQPS